MTDGQLKAEATYNAAADSFDKRPLAFWDRYGQRTVERLSLSSGARVLDVCCGTGASALPAAQAVGPDGAVVAVDLADELLKLGREKAAAADLSWLDFRRDDMSALPYTDGAFDAVICAFGIFFANDMEAQVTELWRMVRPGGQLAVTTWGPNIFAPAYEYWLTAVRDERPDLYSPSSPWDRITTPGAVRELFAEAGIDTIEVAAEEGYQSLSRPEDFWTIALGSGLWWTIDQMTAGSVNRVKAEVLARIAADKVERVETNVIYAVGRKDPPP